MSTAFPVLGRPLAAVALALAAAALPGCAAALRTAPPLAELVGGEVPPPAEAPALRTRAQALYAKRTATDARDAASLALRAAAAVPADEGALLLGVETLVWLADHEGDAAAREAAATRAVQVAQWCGKRAAPSPACSFWLGAALGVQARERPMTGASALPQIEAAFKAAAAGDPAYESGGPDRALAIFYVRAPGWPLGPGDPETGLAHARRAMAQAPDHPPNLLALSEALAATGDRPGAAEQARAALARARAALESGDPDAAEWVRDAEVASRVGDGG